MKTDIRPTSLLAKTLALTGDVRVRGWTVQLLAVLIVAWVGWSIADTGATNLAEQNITAGFGFLYSTAGFEISQTLINYEPSASYGRAFIAGLLNTLLVAGSGIVAATLLGGLLGIARLSGNRLIAGIAAVYVEINRNIPLLLQLFFWYIAVLGALPGPRDSLSPLPHTYLNNRGLFLPEIAVGNEVVLGGAVVSVLTLALVGIWRHRRRPHPRRTPGVVVFVVLSVVVLVVFAILTASDLEIKYPTLQGFNFQGGVRVLPEFVALLIALSTYTGAFIAEIVRGGILAVDKGQRDAARTLGLRPWLILWLVIIPQALRAIIPPLTSQYLNLVKNSSLAVAIAYPDLVSVGGTILNQTGQAVEVIGLWMAIYLTISLSASAFMNWWNHHMALVER